MASLDVPAVPTWRLISPTRARRALSLCAVSALSALAGCGAGAHTVEPPAKDLVVGFAGGTRPLDRAGARVAATFAEHYGASAYRLHPQHFAHVSAIARRSIAAAALRVPAARHRLRPRLLHLRLRPDEGGSLEGTAWIGDGRSPPFSIGFKVTMVRGVWKVTRFTGAE